MKATRTLTRSLLNAGRKKGEARPFHKGKAPLSAPILRRDKAINKHSTGCMKKKKHGLHSHRAVLRIHRNCHVTPHLSLSPFFALFLSHSLHFLLFSPSPPSHPSIVFGSRGVNILCIVKDQGHVEDVISILSMCLLLLSMCVCVFELKSVSFVSAF